MVDGRLMPYSESRRDLTMTSISRCRTRRYRAFAPYSAREAFASSVATTAGNLTSSWPTKPDVGLTFTPIRSMRQV